MADFNSTQPSFSAGIISTELFSRIDFSKLASGVRQCENFEVRPAGGVTYRTGTEFVAEVKDSTSEVNMIEFSESRETGYALEFGNNYIRFYKDGARIESGGVPVEVATTYTSSEISELKYAQYKNQMFIVHPNHAPAILTRNSDTNWTLTTMVFNPSIPEISTVTITKMTAKDQNTVVDYDGWQYAVSVEDKDGREGMATKSNIITSDIDLLNQHIKVAFSAPDGVTDGCNFNIYRIYRGEFFFVYKMPFVTGTTSYEFTDLSFTPDTTRSIKVAFDGFDNSNYPAAVGFWNQRLVFANTPKKPNAIYGSCVGVFDDFTNTILNNSDEAFELELNSGTTDEITDIVPMDDLIIMTQSKIWRVVGTSPSSMQAYIESYSGSSGIRPYVYKKSILYVDSSYNTVSNFIYSYELNGYVGQNLDTLCRDLLDGHTIKFVSFRDTPYGIMYVVRNDGVMLGLTYLKEENIYAWHMHTTDGKFLNVCAVDRPVYDNVYVIVQRGDKKYVEMFKDHINVDQDVDDSWHLDCASRHVETTPYYGWEDEDESVVYTASATPSAGDAVYSDLMETSAGTVTSYSDGKIVFDSKEYDRCTAADGKKQVASVSGLSRFNGRKVTVMADRNEYKDVDVVSGVVTLERPASNILIGLPYVGILEPIPVDIKFQDSGTTVGLNRRISKATIRYFRTRGLWYGTSLKKLYQIKPYVYEDIGYDIPLETNVLNVEVSDTYKTESSLIVVQKSPFPALVQSITMGMAYGEKN